MSGGADPAEINSIWNLARRFADVILTNGDRWVLASSAARDDDLIPSDSVVLRNSSTIVARTYEARRIRNISGALLRHFAVSMNTAAAHWRMVERASRA